MKKATHDVNASTSVAMDGNCGSSSLLNCSSNVSRADAPVADGPNSLLMKKYPGVRQCRSGRWSAKIKFGKYSTYHLGTFETAEEAANAFTRARMERDSRKINQTLDLKEAQTSLKKGAGMKSIFQSTSGVRIVTKEGHREGASSLKECKFGSLVLPKSDWETQQGCSCSFRRKSLELESVNCTKGKVQHHSKNKATDGFRPSRSSLNCSNNESIADSPFTNRPGSVVLKNNYVGVRQTRSGRWSAKIKYGKYSTCHLGTFETAEEAADAFARARRERDS